MEGMIACDTVVWLWCLPPVSSPAMMELPGRFMTTEFLLEDLSWGQTRGIQRKPFPAFAVFQGTTVQNNRYAKVTYVRVMVPELLQLYLRWHALLPFSLHHFVYS